MIRLSEPSNGLAGRILNEVGFEQRFVGVRMTSMAGNALSSIYSLEEASAFLRMDSLQDLLTAGSHTSIGYLDLDRLIKWIDEVFGDQELAEEIGKEIEDKHSYPDRVKTIKKLMEHRLAQCKRIMRDKSLIS